MSGDVKLDGDWVILEGKWARVQTWDLMLDAPDRRTNAAGVRRAMVHAFGDRLILNFARDYPGGVEIQGPLSLETVEVSNTLKVHGDLSLSTADASQVKIGGRRLACREAAGTPAERTLLGDEGDANPVELRGAGLVVRGVLEVVQEAHFQQPPQMPDVSITPPVFMMPIHDEHGHIIGMQPVQPPSYSLLQKIHDLEAEVQTLRQRLEALEAGNP
jgi:hypothetical protein